VQANMRDNLEIISTRECSQIVLEKAKYEPKEHAVASMPKKWGRSLKRKICKKIWREVKLKRKFHRRRCIWEIFIPIVCFLDVFVGMFGKDDVNVVEYYQEDQKINDQE